MTEPPPRVLVTGAAGRLGRAVTRELAERGLAATGLVRAEDAADADWLLEPIAVGDAGDPAVAERAMLGVAAVIHLAAIATPVGSPPETVFVGNTRATFTVLEAAARAGVRRAAIASSFSVTGLPFAPTVLAPAYLPVDEELPLQVADAYALSKQVDEATAEMMWRRHGLSVVALRLPFLGDPEANLPVRAAKLAEDPAAGVRDLWTYLDYRDAARVCVDAVTVAPPGFHVVGLAAPETLCPLPTELLLDRYLPQVPRRTPFPGRTVPVDVTRAQHLLGFAARFLWEVAG